MSNEPIIICNWYVVREIATNLFWIKEPGFVSFYLFKRGNQGLFIDTGIGLSEKAYLELLRHFDIHEFEVICTHAHSDHIGFNSFAKNCRLSQKEWDKFNLQNEDKQLDYFLESLEQKNELPSIAQEPENKIIGKLKWQPNGFLKAGDHYSFHDLNFDIFESPGHTSGSLIFYEPNLNFIFVGDLVYSGTMYLHLKDSDFIDFIKSLNYLLELINKNPEIKIWPAHNDIPLEKDFIIKTSMVTQLIQQNKIRSIQTISKDKIFEEGELYIHQNVKLIRGRIC